MSNCSGMAYLGLGCNDTLISSCFYPYPVISSLRHGIPRRKKLTSFGLCPRVALTHPFSTCFGHTWGNFCKKRFMKKSTTQNYLKKTKQKTRKTTSKLLKNYPKTFGIGPTPPSLSPNFPA